MQPIDVRALATSDSLAGALRARDTRPSAAASVADVRPVLQALASELHLPLALLSRGRAGWRFEADAFPPASDTSARAPHGWSMPSTTGEADALSGLPIGRARGLEWTLVVPGRPDSWQAGATYARLTAAGGVLREALSTPNPRRDDAFPRCVYGFAKRLSRTPHASGIHSLVLRTLARHTGARIGALAVYKEEDRALAITATHGYPLVLVEHVRIPPGEGVIGTAFLDARPRIGDAPPQKRRRYRTTSYMVVPLTGPAGPLGIVTLTDKRDDLPFDAADLERARILASVAELGLARESADTGMAAVQRLAAVDPVTGLFSRRYFDERLLAEVQRAARHREPLSLLLVDIDDFKRVNDDLGHLEGDRALRGVADVFREGVRIFDVCARLGGDEFVILMPRANMGVATRIAERVRERVQRRFESDALAVTISIGAASLTEGSSPQELIADADRRLRSAKRKGKNGLVVSD